MAVDVTTRPHLLNVNNQVYDFWDLRRMHEGQPSGPGVANYESFRVLPRQAGAGLFVDIGKTAVGLMEAWVRGSSRGGQGLYRVDNVLTTAPTTDSYLSQLTCATTSNGTGNPRIDQVVLVIGDAQHAGGLNKAYIDVLAGTATGGATLDNRTGVAALPASCILLADILVAPGDATVDAADIRDRRPFCLPGMIPPGPGALATDEVTFLPHPAITTSMATIQTTALLDSAQSAVLMFLPRRIVGATKIRWKYQQGATANTGNYALGIFDASGRLYASTAATAYIGTANQVAAEQSVALLATTTFEPGWYYVYIGNGAGTASGAVTSLGCGGATQNVQAKGVYFATTTGGTTIPSAFSATTLTDMAAAGTGASITRLGVPVVTLSVA